MIPSGRFVPAISASPAPCATRRASPVWAAGAWADGLGREILHPTVGGRVRAREVPTRRVMEWIVLRHVPHTIAVRADDETGCSPHRQGRRDRSRAVRPGVMPPGECAASEGGAPPTRNTPPDFTSPRSRRLPRRRRAPVQASKRCRGGLNENAVVHGIFFLKEVRPCLIRTRTTT